MVRASLGCYNTREDVDALASALDMVARGGYRGTYEQSRPTGAFRARGFDLPFSRYFDWFDHQAAAGERSFSETA